MIDIKNVHGYTGVLRGLNLRGASRLEGVDLNRLQIEAGLNKSKVNMNIEQIEYLRRYIARALTYADEIKLTHNIIRVLENLEELQNSIEESERKEQEEFYRDLTAKNHNPLTDD